MNVYKIRQVPGSGESEKYIMKSLFNVNSLMFWDENEIRLRRFFEDHCSAEIKQILLSQNPAWKFFQIEAPILTPIDLINPNYTNQDVWIQEQLDETETQLVLRPETTPSSYVYAQYLLNSNIQKPPLCVWQSAKSFRREQDQVTKNMRLKEFYQMEFQCIYTRDTMNDYQANVLEPICKMFNDLLAMPTRIIESDRLPSYSLKTWDIEVLNSDKWMEICSISKRTDFPQTVKFQVKDKQIEKEVYVLEIAIGPDRLVYNYLDRTKQLS